MAAEGEGVQIGVVNSSHYLLLIDHGRAQEAAQWYGLAFGAQLLHNNSIIAGVLENLQLQRVYYLQLGPVDRGTILEVRDANRPRVEQDHSNAMYCLSSHEADVLYDRAIGAQAVHLGTERFEPLEQVLHKIRDPFGFCWFIGSVHHLPFGLNPNNEPGRVDSAHLVLLVDHRRAEVATQWYQMAFGAAILYENFDRAGLVENIVMLRLSFLQLGNKLIEVREAARPAVEQNHTNSLYVLHSHYPDVLHQRALALQPIVQGTQEDAQVVIHKIRDPYSFSWLIGSMNLIPQEVLGLNQNNANQANV